MRPVMDMDMDMDMGMETIITWSMDVNKRMQATPVNT